MMSALVITPRENRVWVDWPSATQSNVADLLSGLRILNNTTDYKLVYKSMVISMKWRPRDDSNVRPAA